MRQRCPSCQRELAREKETKYLAGDLTRDKVPTSLVKLLKYDCNTRRGCGLLFFVRYDYPLDTALETRIALLMDQALWNIAKKTKPGAAQMRTTVGDFTDEIHRDPAYNWQKVLKYFNLPELRRA